MTSLWAATTPPRTTSTLSLRVDRTADVVVVGGGFTGLWTARSIADSDPTRRVILLEAQQCGFGASGRNGGWCSALFPASTDSLTERYGPEPAAAMMLAMRSAVDEVGRAADEDGIDCHFAKGGTLSLVTNPAHESRLRAHMAVNDVWLDAESARLRVHAATLHGAAFAPDCAALHPGRLVNGLADAVIGRGVEVHEYTPVTEIAPGRVRCATGATVRADHVVVATEGYTATLAQFRRHMVPLYSLMIATEPLTDALWDQIGLRERETFTDGRHLLIYGQRTADGRLAFGGRGAPYHFGSRISQRFDTDVGVFGRLERELVTLFPQLAGVSITHRWGGPLGVPRDWMASVGVDPDTGIGWAGGYVGDGVATTNLGGRTMADLILGIDSDLTRLPWVGHRSPDWEPEPLRWLGIRAGALVAELADRAEARNRRPARWAEAVMDRLTG